MLSINTDLSGLIIQNSMTSSTAKLNQAIERMSTGYKINHAKDNAANYSINTEMTSKLGAYNVAADNVSMGIDLLTTASDTISQMQTRGERLRSLIVQSRNGTYGAQSLESMQTEAMSLVSEITRLYTTSNYNQIDLFTNTPYDIAEHLPQASPTGFINPNTSLEVRDDGFILDPVEYSKTQVDNMITVTKAYNDGAFEANKEYSVSNLDELQKLAGMVNSGIDTTNVTFVLAGDIDLESIANWTPIGTETNTFKGKFNGNGHVIKNLNINMPGGTNQGLFGVTATDSEIKNVGIVNAKISTQTSVGALVGKSSSKITNCYSTGKISWANNTAGGLIGYSSGAVSHCYSSVNVNGWTSLGGFVSLTTGGTTTYCFATGNVTATGGGIGGFANQISGTVSNCYATGDVTATTSGGAGGFVSNSYGNISNCFATGDVSGVTAVGGFIAKYSNGTTTNCYATGDVSGTSNVGGFAGHVYNILNPINKCFATGDVSGTSSVGGFAGLAEFGNSNKGISNSYSTGNVSGTNNVGGLVGKISKASGSASLTNCASYGIATGTTAQGSLVGAIANSDGTTTSTINISDCEAVTSKGSSTIGGTYLTDGTENTSYDMTAWFNGIRTMEYRNTVTSLQVGIDGDNSSQINFDINFKLDLNLLNTDLTSDNALSKIDDFLNLMSEKATELGAIENRLQCALTSIEVNIENLTSSRSTLRDADIAKESAKLVQAQILQQASATLMASSRNVRQQNVLGLLQGLRR